MTGGASGFRDNLADLVWCWWVGPAGISRSLHPDEPVVLCACSGDDVPDDPSQPIQPILFFFVVR